MFPPSINSNREQFQSEMLLENIIQKREYFQSSNQISQSQVACNIKKSIINNRLQPQVEFSRVSIGFNQVWKKGSIRIIFLISTFLKILKFQTDSYKFKLLNKKIFQIIDDNAADFYYYVLKGYFQNQPSSFIYQKIKPLLTNLTKNLNSYIPIIMPDNYFKIAFDITLLLLTVLNIFYIPMKLAFDFTKEQGLFLYFVFDFLPSLVFILDIILHFNTAYYSQGIMNTNRKKIFYYYIKGDFIWDLIVIIPFLISRFNIPYIDFVLLLRIRSVQVTFQDIEDATSIREKFGTLIDLSKLIYFLIFVNHFCACIWHFIGQLQIQYDSNQMNWIYFNQLHDSSWQKRYIYSFYWSTITTLTVGYGDITPVSIVFLINVKQNDLERIVTIIVVIICSLVFGYTLTSIQQIFQQLREKNDEFKNNMAQIISYIKSRNINKPLQLKIRKYFEYYFKNQQNTNDYCQQLIEQLSYDLKQQVKVDMYWKILSRCKLVTDTFSQSFLNQVCQIMKLKKYNPGDEIFHEKNKMNDLLFLLKGEIQIFANKKKLRTYHQGYVIGLKNFITSKPIQVSAKANRFVEVAYIQQEDFLLLLREYPEDFERFYQLKDSIIYNNRSKFIIDICPVCISNHTLKNCPFTFYRPNRNKLLSNKNVKNQEINRRFDLQIQDKRKHNSFNRNRQIIQDQVIDYCLSNQFLGENEIDEQKFGLFPSLNPFQQGNVKVNSDQMDQESNGKMNIIDSSIKSKMSSQKKGQKLKPDQFIRQLSIGKSSSNIYQEQIRIKSPIDMIQAIKSEYLEYVNSDCLPQLDKYKNYEFYFAEKNCTSLLKQIGFSNKNLQFYHKKSGKIKKYQMKDQSLYSQRKIKSSNLIESRQNI